LKLIWKRGEAVGCVRALAPYPLIWFEVHMTILSAVVGLAAAICAIGFRQLTLSFRTQGITSRARTTGNSIITRNVESSNKFRSTSVRMVSNSDSGMFDGSFEAFQLAHAATTSMDDSRAVPMLEKAVELETSSKLRQAMYRARLAFYYNKQWRLVEAAEQCEIVSSSYPITILKDEEQRGSKVEETLLLCKSLIGEINDNLGRNNEQSIADLQYLVRYIPDNIDIKYRLANLLIDSGDTEKALELLDSVAHGDPNAAGGNLHTWMVMVMDAGVASASLGNPQEAQRYFGLVIEQLKRKNLGVEWSEVNRFMLYKMANDLSLGDETSLGNVVLMLKDTLLNRHRRHCLMYQGLEFTMSSWVASTW
jgi:hypothetical protein